MPGVDRQIVRIIGVPMDLGQNRRGVDMGPSAIRYAGLKSRLEELSHTVYDHGNIPVPNPEEEVAEGSAKRLQIVADICTNIYGIARKCVGRGEFAIFLGGDHSISIGSISAVAREDESVGVIWVDAHADFNTPESSPSGNIHGMPVAVLAGEGEQKLVDLGHRGRKLHPSQIVQVGLRDLDAVERGRLAGSGISAYSMRHVDELGMAAVARQALGHLKQRSRIHVSLDMDSLDPSEAPGVGTPVPGGLSYREAHLLMEILGDSGRVTSVDVVEINPILDQSNRTAELAVELVASLLGQRIL